MKRILSSALIFLAYCPGLIAEDISSIPEDSYAYYGDIWRPAVHRNILPFVFLHALYEGWLKFIHTWTDVISLSATYTVRTKKLTVILPTLNVLL